MNADTFHLLIHMKIHKVEINVPVIDSIYICIWDEHLYIWVYMFIYTTLIYILECKYVLDVALNY